MLSASRFVRKSVAIETPGADYPPSEEFTEDLENEDVPPEKLPKRGRSLRGGRGRLGWEDLEEKGIGGQAGAGEEQEPHQPS